MRDFVGYGQHPPRVEWPNGARIAISMVVNYEEGSEYSLLDGDAHRETNSEVPSPLPMDERDLANESFFEYGSRAGVWRVMRLLKRFDVPATFYCCALALERNPEVGPAIVEQGHEVFGHGLPLGGVLSHGPRRRARGDPKGGGVHRANDGRAAPRLVHAVRSKPEHARAGGRRGRVPVRLELLRGRHTVLRRGARQAVAGGSVLAGGQRHALLAGRHEQPLGLLPRRSRTLSTCCTKRARSRRR